MPADVFAETGDKRTREKVELSPERQAPVKERKLKKGSRGKKAYRHILMMQDRRELDLVRWVRDRPIRTEDGMTFGDILDKSPVWTTALSKSLVRPTRKKLASYAPIPPATTPGFAPVTTVADSHDVARIQHSQLDYYR